MDEEYFFKHPALPFVEYRRSRNSERHYKPHMHQTFCVGAIDRGEVVYQVEGTKATLRPGSLALINPETLHSCNPIESGRRSYHVLHLDVEWCLQVQQSLWSIDAFRPVDSVLLDNASVYHQYIDAMESLIGEGELLEKEQILVDVVENIFLQACAPAIAIGEPSLRIEQLKQQLSMNLDMNISMQQMSSTLHANPYTLLRQFKAVTGLTPHAYRLNCRIEYARKLLQKGIDLSEVALECGFVDQSHFHRHFKAMTAVTPKEYQVNFIQ